MRFLFIFSLLLAAAQISGQTSTSLTLPAGTSMLLTGGGPGQDAAPAGDLPVAATLRNSKGSPIDVRVMKDGEQVRGFGLNQRGEATVYVGAGERLLLDGGDQEAQVSVSYAPASPPAEQPTDISFTLKNSSLRSIPLKIPGVMNPNLSPMSKSGVRLAQGQEIIYRGEVILRVGPEISEGQIIDVASLIHRED